MQLYSKRFIVDLQLWTEQVIELDHFKMKRLL